MDLNLVAEIVGQEPFYGKLNPGGLSRTMDYMSFARRAVYKSDIRVPWAEEKMIEVTVSKLEIVSGRIEKRKIDTYSIPALKKSMDSSEYCAEMDRIKSMLPPEFHSFIEGYAYQKGHDAGFEEVCCYAKDLVEHLVKPIEEFKKRLTSI